MAMTKRDFEMVAEAIADAAEWTEDMTAEQLRQALGKRLMHGCQQQYAGGYGFKTEVFKRTAKLDD